MSYYWVAIYKDGKHLTQYNEDGTENRFSDIDFSCLDIFSLVSKLDNIYIGVRTGIIKVRGVEIKFPYENNRLVYFRTVKQNIGANTDRSVTQWFGLQNTINQKNYKFILGLDEQTNKILSRCE